MSDFVKVNCPSETKPLVVQERVEAAHTAVQNFKERCNNTVVYADVSRSGEKSHYVYLATIYSAPVFLKWS